MTQWESYTFGHIKVGSELWEILKHVQLRLNTELR